MSLQEKAFPTTQYAHGISPSGHSEGMTLRDYFAAKALNFCLLKSWGDDEAAQRAYEIADFMLEARK